MAEIDRISKENILGNTDISQRGTVWIIKSNETKCSFYTCNIAEGYGRHSTGDYIRVPHISVGSLYELQTQVEISFQLKYIIESPYKETIGLCTEIDKILYVIIQKLKENKA